MTIIVADPFLVLQPDPCYSADELNAYLFGLLGWADAVNREDIPFVFSDACLSGLLSDGWYPFNGRLAQLLKDFDAPASEDLVNQVVQNIITREPTLESFLQIEDLSFDEESLELTPDVFTQRLGQQTSKGFVKSLVFVSAAAELLQSISPEYFLASRQCEMPEPHLTMTTLIDAILPLDDHAGELIDRELPKTVRALFTPCSSYKNILANADVMDLFAEAADAGHVMDAINKMIDHHQAIGLPPERKEFQSYRLGAHFIDSLHQYSIHSRQDWARLVIDSCARIVLGVPKDEVKGFRDDDRPQAQQRTRARDGALAWRTHLTKSNEGFRLMFWTTTDGVVEFANVGPKKELIIYE